MFLDLLFLYALGVLGWQLGMRIKLPIAPLLGALFLVSSLRGFGLELPNAPTFLGPTLQVFLGISVGCRFKQDLLSRLKEMILPGAIIVLWVLMLLFLMGSFLTWATYLDPITAYLSSCLGGLPEMTIIAISVEADLGVILFIQFSRMILTYTFFPIYVKYREKDKTYEEGEQVVEAVEKPKLIQILLVFLLGLGGGILFLYLKIPAGGLVGSMLFVFLGTLFGLRTFTFPHLFHDFLYVGVGLLASSSITPVIFSSLFSKDFLIAWSLSLFFIFSSSIGVIYLLKRITKWDETTCVLAVAPAGFTVMVLLALEYDRDPVQIAILHLCRLIMLKSIIPFLFLFLQ